MLKSPFSETGISSSIMAPPSDLRNGCAFPGSLGGFFAAAPPDVRNGCAFPGGLATEVLGYAPCLVAANKVSCCANFLTTQKQGVARKKAVSCSERRSHSAHRTAEPKNMRLRLFLTLALLCTLYSLASAQVRFTRGTLEIPTYTIARSETVAPLFKSVDSAALYPYARLDRDSMSRKPVPVKYESLTLENEYLRLVILPELGGRIWSARDKLANRELFHYTSVIKPTVYNQRGGWPAGNLEVYGPYDAHMLTWPGEPWPWAFRQNPDGSATVILSHIDHFFRNKLSFSVTLRPARSFIKLNINLRNNNLLPNRYLLWTNAGIRATDGTRFVYPMTRTIGHDSSALSTWPVANGVDLSWQKNNQNMLGVFGLDLYDDFIAAYDYHEDYGTICYTNRKLARGVKTWTWGVGEAAMRQMKHYSDNNDQYLEVQSGRFVWDGNYEFIEPGKSDGWTEYWFAAGKLGGLTTASRDVAIHFEQGKLAVTATGVFANATLTLTAGEAVVWNAKTNLTPANIYRAQIVLKPEFAGRTLKLEVRAADNTLLAQYAQHPDGSHPDTVFAADSIPRQFAAIEKLTAEEAYQKGLAHEKFGALEEAQQAYQAALAKDNKFTAPHLRLGLLALDRSLHNEAMQHFQAVLERDPANGDAHYYLAVALTELGKPQDAARHYFRLLPSSAKFEQRDYGLGLLALQAGDFKEASLRLSQAVATAPTQLSMRQAYAFTLRKLGRTLEAQKECNALLALDPTNAFAQAEKLFLSNLQSPISNLQSALANHEQGYLELACEYLRLSAYTEAQRIIERGLATLPKASPLLHYFRAFCADRNNDANVTRQSIDAARKQTLALEIFPFRRETIRVLQRVRELEPKDANATCLLGEILFYRARREDAMTAWRAAIASDPRHFSSLRDLGLALLEAGKHDEALSLLSRAAELRSDLLSHTLLVAKLQAQAGNNDAAQQMLERAHQQQPNHDRVTEALAMLAAQSGNHQRALELLRQHTFEPQHQSYALLHLWQATQLMSASKANPTAALTHIRAAQQPPATLGMDDFSTLRSARLLVFEALWQQAKGASDAATKAWQAAAATMSEGKEEGLFAALALEQTGATERAAMWFRNFRAANERSKTSDNAQARALAFYLAGVDAALHGQAEDARANLRRALEIDRTSLWAQQALLWLDAGLLTPLTK
jgi:tetratricopeptide (TPR) repeat protein